MENASKALLIAGEVLIAVLIASMFSLLFSTVSEYSKDYERKREVQEMQAFNAKFTNYIKSNQSTAQDVISILNLATEWNTTNEYTAADTQYYIEVTIAGKTNPNSWGDAEKITFLKDNDVENFGSNTASMKKYTATISYSDVTGRINKIEFN